MTPGLTCARCRADLYPHVATTTEAGFQHAHRCGRACGVEGCPDQHHANGYCMTHNRRWRKYGDPLHDIHTADADARLEDLRWMAETGEGLTVASARVGEKVKTVEAFLRRYDRECLALLIAQEPRDHNRRPDRVSIAELTGLTERRNKRKRVAA